MSRPRKYDTIEEATAFYNAVETITAEIMAGTLTPASIALLWDAPSSLYFGSPRPAQGRPYLVGLRTYSASKTRRIYINERIASNKPVTVDLAWINAISGKVVANRRDFAIAAIRDIARGRMRAFMTSMQSDNTTATK